MKFPVPHDVKAQTIPGTEGWERIYPYQYQFVTDDPVRNQYEEETWQDPDELNFFVSRLRVGDVRVRSPATVSDDDTMQACLSRWQDHTPAIH